LEVRNDQGLELRNVLYQGLANLRGTIG